LPTIQFDSEAIHRAVLNVGTNAVDACEGREGGKVEIATKYLPERNLAQVMVADNGVGMTSEQLPTIFQAFVSGKGARGTGLGLPVSQKIIKEHGGRILVESEPDQGSRFTLEFPAILGGSVRETNISNADEA
jgi:signal transduction histidine kinase